MNSRYVAYARAHGRTPDEMMATDVETYPGGKMCGFILWVQKMWQDFDSARENKRGVGRSKEEHRAFDSWLDGVSSNQPTRG